MEGYPDRGLDVEDALRVQDQFDEHLKYFISPGPIAEKIHKDVEAGSRLLALTGSVSEKGGKRWITVTRYEPAEVNYPETMLAPDRPFSPAGREPLVLKIGGTLTLTVHPAAGRPVPPGVAVLPAALPGRVPPRGRPDPALLHVGGPRHPGDLRGRDGQEPVPQQGPPVAGRAGGLADILEFCRIVSRKNGVTVRLPTDAEWEYSARVGTSNPCLTEKYRDQISETGGRPDSTPVRSREPNAWGLYDMLCGGWHVTGDYKADNVRTRQVDPNGPAATDRQVHRDATGLLHKTRGGPHYDHRRPNIHGDAAENGTIWEGGARDLPGRRGSRIA